MSPRLAFVLQFHPEADVAEGFLGRVEHVVSGRSVRFASFEELVAFLARTRELLAAGKQVIIFSSNDSDGNNHRGGEWIWPEVSKTEVKPTEFDFEACTPKAGGDHFWQADDKKWSGVSEDRTEFGLFNYKGLLGNERVGHLVRCNVTSISVDMIHASERTSDVVCVAGALVEGLTDHCGGDERVNRTIWSWREDDRGQHGNRALFSGADGRWDSRNGVQQHHFACAKPRGGRPATWTDKRGEHWRVTMQTGTWNEGHFYCQAEYGTEGFVYAAPVNGFQNDQLREARAVASQHMDAISDDVWINYAKKPDGSGWEVNPGPSVPSVTTVSVPTGAVYDGTSKVATAQTTGEGAVIASPAVSYTPPGAPVNAGSYTARADFPGDAIYLPSADSKTFAIAKGSSVTAVTAGNATYDGQPHGGTATATGAGGLSQSVTVTYGGRAGTAYGPGTTPPTAAGSYTASADFPGDANHTGSQGSAAFAIARAPLTVTAENQSRAYGAPNPAFTATASGLVNDDTLAGIGITCDTSATPTSNVGAYDIICAGDPANYGVTFVMGTLTVTKAPTGLGITSADALALDAQGRVTVTARLTWHNGADPLADQIVTFNAGGVSASGTTGANGVATATLTLPSELYTLTASFAGDANYQPSQAEERPGVIIYQQSRFVIWGGNTPNLADTIQVGRDYQFWGAQWVEQVTGGDYKANSSFKGYADTVSADGTHWTSRPGNSSGPPATVPPYIGVIVATQVTKNGPTISGNITRLVVLKVDAPENYRPNPGHAGTGVLVTILP